MVLTMGQGRTCIPASGSGLEGVVYLLHGFLPVKLFVRYVLTVAVFGPLMVYLSSQVE